MDPVYSVQPRELASFSTFKIFPPPLVSKTSNKFCRLIRYYAPCVHSCSIRINYFTLHVRLSCFCRAFERSFKPFSVIPPVRLVLRIIFTEFPLRLKWTFDSLPSLLFVNVSRKERCNDNSRFTILIAVLFIDNDGETIFLRICIIVTGVSIDFFGEDLIFLSTLTSLLSVIL